MWFDANDPVKQNGVCCNISSWGYYFTKLSGIYVYYETKSVENGNASKQVIEQSQNTA
jgi:hypothetical protein